MSGINPKPQVVPFGKYKGKPVEAMAQDREYCDWLLAQDWFSTKFTAIHTLIVNNFGEPSETPEHNALQVLFTDEEWATRFVAVVVGEAHLRTDFESSRNYQIQEAQGRIKELESGMALEVKRKNELEAENIKTPSSYFESRIKQQKDAISESLSLIELKRSFVDNLGSIPFGFTVSARFEVEAVDVLLDYHGPIFEKRGHTRQLAPIGCLHVECKPSIGDDYPAILRQIDNARARLGRTLGGGASGVFSVLLVGNGGCTASGATVDQIRAIFATRQVKIVMLCDFIRLNECADNAQNVSKLSGSSPVSE